jgi:Arc/MetJ-type ribon-helix-helix transcriptional regulator
MEVHITPTPEQEVFIKQAIASGPFKTAEDAAREALRQWEEQEPRRMELLIDLDAAKASLARGDGPRLTAETVEELTQDVKRRGRSRLAPRP